MQVTATCLSSLVVQKTPTVGRAEAAIHALRDRFANINADIEAIGEALGAHLPEYPRVLGLAMSGLLQKMNDLRLYLPDGLDENDARKFLQIRTELIAAADEDYQALRKSFRSPAPSPATRVNPDEYRGT